MATKAAKAGKKPAESARPKDRELEGPREDETDDEKPTKTVARPKESEQSKLARQRKREPDELAALRRRKRVEVDLIAIELGWNNEVRVRPGAKFRMKVPLDDDGNAILPTWAVFPEDYREAPEKELPPGMKPKVRGGATVGGVKPKL